MKVGIHTCPFNDLNGLTKKHVKILEYNNIDYVLLNSNEPDFLAKLREIDHFIYIWGHRDDYTQLAHDILPVIENHYNIKCFPNQDTCWHYDNKIRQYLILHQYDFPFTQSWIFYNDIKAPLDWIKQAELPVVFKLYGGAGSSNVILINSKRQAEKLIKKQFSKGIKTNMISDTNDLKFKEFNLYNFLKKKGRKAIKALTGEDRYRKLNWGRHTNYVLFQKFLPKNDFDTRVSVIGGRAFAFRRFNRKDDFRSSGSGLINYEVDKINLEFIKIALDISKKLNFQSMAYDFLYNENGEPEFCEISYVYKDSAVYDCKGYWDSDLQFHEGHFWPQYFQLVDFLELPDLKQPNLPRVL